MQRRRKEFEVRLEYSSPSLKQTNEQTTTRGLRKKRKVTNVEVGKQEEFQTEENKGLVTWGGIWSGHPWQPELSERNLEPDARTVAGSWSQLDLGLFGEH